MTGASAGTRPPPEDPGAGRRRVGLLGGSFDPVHAGHLHAARAAVEAFGLDRVVFVPAARPPHKPGRELAAGEDRLAMLRLAIAGEPRYSALALELERRGPSYTIDTVRALPSAIGEPESCGIFLILGSDNLPGLPDWREAEALLERVQPIVVHRDGEPERMLDDAERRLGPAAARKLRAGYLSIPPVPVSSTELRRRLPGLEPGIPEIPKPVLDYIRARGLYGTKR